MQKKKIELIRHYTALYGSFLEETLRRRIRGHFGSERTRTVSLFLSFLVSSDDVDPILLSYLKVSREYALLSSICVFFIELFIFFAGSRVVKVSSCQIPRL